MRTFNFGCLTEVEAALKSDAPCHLVDIRTSEEWDAVHLEALHQGCLRNPCR